MSVVCFGELLIDFVALESGVKVGQASGFEKAPGGAPANVAVAVRRLGMPSAFIGQVGDDPFGHYLAQTLYAEGVDTRGLKFSEQARTMLAFVSLTAEGERSFVFYRHPSADMLMRPEDVELDVLNDASVFHFGSITLISEPARSATLLAAQTARNRGLLISYDPNLRLNLWPDADTARMGMLIGLDDAHIVKISLDELEFLTGGRDVSQLWRDQTQIIVVTHGQQGATIYTRYGTFRSHLPSFKVSPVDTTGAGDAFVAGMLVGILQRWNHYIEDMAEVVRFANAVGALATTGRGAIPSLPTREQVRAFAHLPD